MTPLVEEARRGLPQDLAGVTHRLVGRPHDESTVASAAAAVLAAMRHGEIGRESESALAAALALSEGGLVVPAEGGFVVPAKADSAHPLSLLLATYLAALRGDRVHVLLSDQAAVEDFLVQWSPVLRGLGLSLAGLTGDGDVEGLRRLYDKDVVIGWPEQFCDDYLRDHVARSRNEFVDANYGFAVVPSGAKVLSAALGQQVLLRDSRGGEEFARMLMSDLLFLYKTWSAVVTDTTAKLDELAIRYRCDILFLEPREHKHRTLPGSGVLSASVTATDAISAIERLHRGRVYGLRNRVLRESEVREIVFEMLDAVIESCMATHHSAEEAIRRCRGSYRPDVCMEDVPVAAGRYPADARRFLRSDVRSTYEARIAQFAPAVVDSFERRVLLTVLGIQWREHLKRLDRDSSRVLTSPGKADRLIGEYRRSSDESEAGMWRTVSRHVLGYLFNAEPGSTTS